MYIFRKAYDYLQDLCFVWFEELKQLVKDEGVIIFFVVVPLVYPLLYSWIYNNEQVRDVPVVVVDMSHSSLSRQFIRMCDASPDVKIAYYAQDLDEAQSLVSRQLAKGVYFIPSDFDDNLNRMQQGVISVYCDMSLMLTYKAVFQTAQAVSSEMGTELKTKLAGLYTVREEVISAKPLDFDDVPMYNPAGGYGSGILPAVLVLILQQTLVLGIGLSAGTARDSNRFRHLIPVNAPHYSRTLPIVFGKALCYFMVYAIMGTWLLIVVPRIFHFPHLASWQSLLTVLFMTGVSWPQSNIPGIWQGVSWLFPSTFGARAFVRLNSMGATPADVLPEFRILWIQTGAYFLITCLVYRFQFFMAKRDLKKYGDSEN